MLNVVWSGEENRCDRTSGEQAGRQKVSGGFYLSPSAPLKKGANCAPSDRSQQPVLLRAERERPPADCPVWVT